MTSLDLALVSCSDTLASRSTYSTCELLDRRGLGPASDLDGEPARYALEGLPNKVLAAEFVRRRDQILDEVVPIEPRENCTK